MAGKSFTMEFLLSASQSGGFSGAFKSGQDSIMALQREIVALNKSQGDISAYQKQQSAVEATGKKLAELQQHYDNIQREIAETDGFSSRLESQLLSKGLRIQDTSEKLETHTEKLDQMGTALSEAGIDTNNLTEESARLGTEMEQVAQKQEEAALKAEGFGAATSAAFLAAGQALVTAGIVKALKEITEHYKECIDASVEFESAMTGVAKTTDMSGRELAAMGESIKQLSTEIPIATTELAGIMENAGQLGIHNENLLSFTRTMADLGVATNLTGEQAAQTFAKFANITGMSQTEFSNLGSTIVHLGNNLATTEADIAAMALRLSAAGTQAGFTQAEIVGLAGALSSVGLEAEAGGTAFSKTINMMTAAVETGSERLEDFASIAGMSAEEFAQAYRENAAGALVAFTEGLGDMESHGKSAIVMLDELGFTQERLRDALTRAANAEDLFKNSIAGASAAWRENIALATEAELRYGTTESKFMLLENSVTLLKQSIGDALTPALGNLAEVGAGAAKWAADWAASNPEVIQGITAVVSAVGVFTVAMTAVGAAINVVIPALKTLWAAAAAHPIILLASALAGVTVAVGFLVASVKEANPELIALQKNMENTAKSYEDAKVQIAAQGQSIDSLVSQLDYLRETTDGSTGSMAAMQDVMSQLASLAPELAGYFDQETGAILDGYDAIVASTQARLKHQAAIAHAAKVSADLTTAEKNLANAKAELVALEAQGIDKSLIDMMIRDGLIGLLSEEQLRYIELQQGIKGYSDALEENVNLLSEAEAEVEAYSAAAAEQGEAIESVVDAMEQQANAIDKVKEAYDQAYAAALNSIQGQYALWDQVESKATKSVQEIKSALESQITHWQNYDTNLRALMDANVDGLLEMVATFADGSADSVNYVASLAELSKEELAGIVSYWQEVNAQELAAADTSAELHARIAENATGMSQTVAENTAGMVETVATDTAAMNSEFDSGLGAMADKFSLHLDELGEGFADKGAELQEQARESTAAVKEEFAANTEAVREQAAETISIIGNDFATGLAQMEADFASSMSAIQSRLEAAVAAMNMASRASAAGRNTIQGFINGAMSMLPAVVSAYTRIAQAAVSAVDRAMKINSPSKAMAWRSEMAWTGFIEESKAMTPEVQATMAHTASMGMDAVSKEDVKMVALAPQLMGAIAAMRNDNVVSVDPGIMLHRSQPESTRPVNVYMNIHIAGTATPETVAALRDYEDDFAEKVREVIEGIDQDKRRGRY